MNPRYPIPKSLSSGKGLTIGLRLLKVNFLVRVVMTVIMVVVMSMVMSMIVTVFVAMLSSLYILKKDRLLTRSKSTMYRVTEFLDRCLELVL